MMEWFGEEALGKGGKSIINQDICVLLWVGNHGCCGCEKRLGKGGNERRGE